MQPSQDYIGCLVFFVNSETKVVLKGNNTVQLTDLASKAGNLGLPNFSVQDAGKTQVKLHSHVLDIQCLIYEFNMFEKSMFKYRPL